MATVGETWSQQVVERLRPKATPEAKELAAQLLADKVASMPVSYFPRMTPPSLFYASGAASVLAPWHDPPGWIVGGDEPESIEPTVAPLTPVNPGAGGVVGYSIETFVVDERYAAFYSNPLDATLSPTAGDLNGLDWTAADPAESYNGLRTPGDWPDGFLVIAVQWNDITDIRVSSSVDEGLDYWEAPVEIVIGGKAFYAYVSSDPWPAWSLDAVTIVVARVVQI